jgi:hypothetical protein
MMLGGYINIQARPTPQLWVAPPVVVPPGDGEGVFGEGGEQILGEGGEEIQGEQ